MRTTSPSAPNLSLSTRHASYIRLVRALTVALGALPAALASPINYQRSLAVFPAGGEAGKHESVNQGEWWAYFGTAFFLVVFGGVLAGLTIALMGQDEINLQVIAESGDEKQRRQAQKVLNLLRRGKHWVLVTLLLSNVITNETLPIVLDRSLGGGWQAVVISTVLIVIFGEVVPQSICVRYGLPIGAMMSPWVLLLMWITSPIAYPIAKLLDYLLGKDHGTIYKKAGLKTLVTLHRTLGTDATERLNNDEVTIISSVLDLKGKPVGSIMTPIKDVFTLSADTILDEEMIDTILSQGYSRIPIYQPGNQSDFVGMLLVKTLIAYDPEDGLKVSDFTLATLPETRPETSCLDIVNFFQEGKSHMALVSELPGQTTGAIGVVTLEDVIEELIGEEIIDESDVFVDVQRAIRRWTPAPPGMRMPAAYPPEGDLIEDMSEPAPRSKSQSRPSIEVRDSLKQHFGHLGPSNKASDPRSTQIPSITIKSIAQARETPTTDSTPVSHLLTDTSPPQTDNYGTLDGASAEDILNDGPSLNPLDANGSRASSSSGISSRTPKMIIPSVRPSSPTESHRSIGVPLSTSVVNQLSRAPGSTSETNGYSSSPTGSQITTIAVSGPIKQTTVDKKLVITPVPGNDENQYLSSVVATTTTTTSHIYATAPDNLEEEAEEDDENAQLIQPDGRTSLDSNANNLAKKRRRRGRRRHGGVRGGKTSTEVERG